MSENIHATTSVSYKDYPAFINISKNAGELPIITLREAENGGTKLARMVITNEELERLAIDVLRYLELEECPTLESKLAVSEEARKMAEADRDFWREEKYGMDKFHSNSMIEIAKACGEDVSDEPRFKWVYNIVSGVVRRAEAAEQRIEELERQNAQMLQLLKDGAEPSATQEKADIGMCAQWDVDALAVINATSAQSSAWLNKKHVEWMKSLPIVAYLKTSNISDEKILSFSEESRSQSVTPLIAIPSDKD